MRGEFDAGLLLALARIRQLLLLAHVTCPGPLWGCRRIMDSSRTSRDVRVVHLRKINVLSGWDAIIRPILLRSFLNV
jgi:hypothetical protein